MQYLRQHSVMTVLLLAGSCWWLLDALDTNRHIPVSFCMSIALGISLAWLTLLSRLHTDSDTPTHSSLVRAFGYGAALAFCAIAMNRTVWFFYPSASQTFIGLLLLAANEESIKLLAVSLAIRREDECTTAGQGMLLAASAALGLAFTENLAYLQVPWDMLLERTLIRMLVSVPSHAFDTSFAGAALAQVRQDVRNRWCLLVGLMCSTFLHALFNFTSQSDESLGLSQNQAVALLFGYVCLQASIYYLMLRHFNKSVERAASSPVSAALVVSAG